MIISTDEILSISNALDESDDIQMNIEVKNITNFNEILKELLRTVETYWFFQFFLQELFGEKKLLDTINTYLAGKGMVIVLANELTKNLEIKK